MSDIGSENVQPILVAEYTIKAKKDWPVEKLEEALITAVKRGVERVKEGVRGIEIKVQIGD